MPFLTYGGDASESGDEAPRALTVHVGAAAGGEEEPETVAAYTVHVPELHRMPDVAGSELAKPVAVCVDTESDEDVWRRRTPAQRRAVKTRQPTPEMFMTKAVAQLTNSIFARAATALGISNPQSSGGSGATMQGGSPSGGSGAAMQGGSPSGGSGATTRLVGSSGVTGVHGQMTKTEQEEEEQRQSGRSRCSGGADEEGNKTDKPQPKRAPRGSAGTFGGRRPPKDPSKLALFEARKAAHAKAKKDAKDGEGNCPSLRQAQYWQHLSDNLKAGNGMKEQALKQVLKRPAAAADVTTPTPKKNRKKDEKKDKKDDETPEKTDEMASGSDEVNMKKPEQ